MSDSRRPLARLNKFHRGKRGHAQGSSHRDNLNREFREQDDETPAERFLREQHEDEIMQEEEVRRQRAEEYGAMLEEELGMR